MTTPTERIRALRLTDEDLTDVYERWCIGYHFEGDPMGMLEYSMKKQFDKVIKGLIEMMDGIDDYWHTKDVADLLRDALVPSGDET